jgi:hypothetical protein
MPVASFGLSTTVRSIGQTAVQRLRERYPRPPQVQLVHAPTHASWLNQVEIYFSLVQRKVLTPNDFPNLDVLAERLLDFQYYWESTAQPFDWKFTYQDLKELLGRFGQSGSNRLLSYAHRTPYEASQRNSRGEGEAHRAGASVEINPSDRDAGTHRARL